MGEENWSEFLTENVDGSLLTKRVQRGLYDIVLDQVGLDAPNDEPGRLLGPQRNAANPKFMFVLGILRLRHSILARRLTGHQEHL